MNKQDIKVIRNQVKKKMKGTKFDTGQHISKYDQRGKKALKGCK